MVNGLLSSVKKWDFDTVQGRANSGPAEKESHGRTVISTKHV